MNIKIFLFFAAFGSLATALGQPAITIQPIDQTNYVGTSATFAVVATGTEPMTYQWQWQKGSTNFTGLLDETNSTLTIGGVQTNDAADYRVVVTDAAGITNSAAAHLYVNPLPMLTISQPSPGVVILSWQDTNMVLAETWRSDGDDLACAAWVGVTNTSPVTITAGFGPQFFRLVYLSSLPDFASNIDACRGGNVKACEDCVATFLLTTPYEPGGDAEEAASIGTELGSCLSPNQLRALVEIYQRMYGP